MHSMLQMISDIITVSECYCLKMTFTTSKCLRPCSHDWPSFHIKTCVVVLVIIVVLLCIALGFDGVGFTDIYHGG